MTFSAPSSDKEAFAVDQFAQISPLQIAKFKTIVSANECYKCE